MARPTKYNQEVVKRIVQAIQVGSTYELAAKYGGIAYSTFQEWRNTKPAFSEAIEKAEGEAAARWLGRIEQASQDGAWQAAAWKLERRYPQDYGRTVVDNNVSVTAKAPIAFIERAPSGDAPDTDAVPTAPGEI